MYLNKPPCRDVMQSAPRHPSTSARVGSVAILLMLLSSLVVELETVELGGFKQSVLNLSPNVIGVEALQV